MVFAPVESTTHSSEPGSRTVSEGGRKILSLILKAGELSQADITRAADLSQPRVTRLLQGFQQDGMIRVAHRQTDRPGHPSSNVSLNPDFAYSLGVSMMGDLVSMTLMDFTGKVRGEKRTGMSSMSRQPVLRQLKALKAALVKETGIQSRRIIGACVGVSAFFVGERRWLSPPAYLKDWAQMDVEPILADALDVPVTVENDGNVAAIAESLFGVGQRCGHFIYLHLTNGFGGGIIADGKLFRGFHGNAGEFGGVWALCADAYPNLELLRKCLVKCGHRFDSVEEMTQRIDASWNGVELWLEQAVPAFRLLSDILGYCVDPQMIVIGGRLPKSIAGRLVERIDFPRRHHGETRPPAAPVMAVAEAPGEPVALGAAALPLQQVFFL